MRASVKTTKTWSSLALIAGLGTLSGCAPGTTNTPRPLTSDLATTFEKAFEKEANDATSAAPYLDAIELAVANPDAPNALPTVLASLDALVANASETAGLGRTGVAYRSRDGLRLVTDRLRAAWDAGEPRGTPSKNTPFMRGVIAQALHEIALFTGDERAAETWAERRGCATAATVVAPLDWTPLRGLEDPSPIAADAPLGATYAGVAPFAARITPQVVRADRCRLNIDAPTFLQGIRAVVLDLDNAKAQRISLLLTSSAAARVEVGGTLVMKRGFDVGGRVSTRLGVVRAEQGRVRVVVRVADKHDASSIELAAWGEDGLPLRAHAPQPGDLARAKTRDGEAIEIVATHASSPAERLVAATGLLALGEARLAEHLLEPLSDAEKGMGPALSLVYQRAVQQSDDLPDNKQTERVRAAIGRVVEAWPTSWEARIGHAQSTERRKGFGDGPVEALRELGKGLGVKPGDPDRMVSAYTVQLARRAGLIDVAEDAYVDLAKLAPGSPLLAQTDFLLHGRAGVDAVRAACGGGTGREEMSCFNTKRDLGDYQAALDELARLRRLRQAPEAFRDIEISTRILSGDLDGALAIYDKLAPGERRLMEVLSYGAARGQTEAVRRRLRRDEVVARDAPYGIAPITRLLGLEADPAVKFEAESRALVDADRAQAFLPGAATAVLKHVESYTVEPTGLVRWVSYDLRRVTGTTDVAQGGYSFGPMVDGRGAPRLLRRRIHKKDGRVIEPDSAPNSSQGSDLSQLETGDYVEQILEGYALPGDTGQLVVDTPDLLPERQSVREAEITFRRPSSIPMSIWAHPLLGKAEERTDGNTKVSVYRLKNAAPRRIEDGVPRGERSVSLSFGTQTWAQVARALSENIRSFEEHDPYVTRWAEEIAGADPKIDRALVGRVVEATGKKVKIASSGEFSDIAALYGGGSQRQTARSILESGQGSRSWIVYRTLRELGVKADLAIAESEPFSTSADYPPHVGRFRHALVVAHLDDGDVWMDPDIEGPPLPPGRISPELRGRSAMLADGQIMTVAGSTGEAGDEVDLRLTLDDKGDAKGTFTILLHGRTSQGLAEAFETVVGTERRELLRSVVLAWVPWANVDDVTVSSTAGSWEIALRAAVTIRGYGRPEGRDGRVWALPGNEPVHIAFARGSNGTLGARYASRGARQSALSIDETLQYHLHRRVELPAGATVVRSPTPVDVSDARLQASRKIEVKGSTIDETYTLSLPTGTVAAADYQAFVDRVRVVDDGFMASMRVRAAETAREPKKKSK